MISQDRLKRQLSYNKNSGEFTYLVSTGNKAKGQIASSENGYGYIRIRIDKEDYLAHRLAFLYIEGSFPPDCVDHINGVRSDNRWCNLRPATHEENNKNSKRPKDNTSGIIGVTWNRAKEKWEAQIVVSRKKMFLGRSEDKFEAICSRKAAELKYGFHPNHGR